MDLSRIKNTDIKLFHFFIELAPLIVPDNLLTFLYFISNNNKIEAEDASDYYRSLFTNSVKGYRRGSLKEVEKMYYHNDIGCTEDPYSEMHVALDPDDPYSSMFCLCDESMVESEKRSAVPMPEGGGQAARVCGTAYTITE